MSDRPMRIGVLGLTHDHVWSNLQELQACDAGLLAAAADPHQALREKVQQQCGCPTYEHYEAMLDAEQLDAVYVFGDNAAGVELVELAAARGLHALVEKPLAADVTGADRMLSAAAKNHVRLMVNWPFAWWPQMQKALQMAADGEIGDLWQVKYRAAHAGPQELGCSEFFCDWLFDADRNGGGALIDYCCYGALLARCLLGMPQSVSAIAARLVKDELRVEDNGVILMSYPRAIAVSEGSWTQIGNLTSYVTVIYGTQATLLIEPRVGGRLLMATSEQAEGVEVDVPALPAERAGGSANFLACLASGEKFLPLCRADTGRDAQEILSAALVAAQCGASTSLPMRAAGR